MIVTDHLTGYLFFERIVDMSQYINILGNVRVAGKIFPGVCLAPGVNIELVPQACNETQFTALFKDGDRVLAKLNLTAVADVFFTDAPEEELALLEATPVAEAEESHSDE